MSERLFELRNTMQIRGNSPATWDNRDGPRRCANTAEGLTHSSGTSREGLDVKSTSKVCPRCGLDLPLNDFALDSSRRTSSGRQSWCRACRAARAAEQQRDLRGRQPPEGMTSKVCARCKADLPLSLFKAEPRMKSGRSSLCLECSARDARESYAKAPERQRERRRAWAAKNPRSPEQLRARYLKAKYGLTVAEFEQMLKSQGGVCAICHSDTPGGRGTWHVDHCHDTNEIRALLCANCNVGIAQLGHDPERMRAAAKYIEHHRSQS